jgi:hypothetical protein
MCWKRILKYHESEKDHPGYEDSLPYQRFVITSMWNIMQVHMGDQFGFKKVLEERGLMPKFQSCYVNVTKFIGLLKDFCENQVSHYWK